VDFFSQNKIVAYNNPIDCIEDHIHKFDVELFRDTADQLLLKYRGSWSNHEIVIKWDEINKVINISSCFDLEIKTKIKKDIYSVVSSYNEKVNLGYFHYCSQHQEIFFKYQVSIKGLNYMTIEQIEDLLSVVIKECDRFFPIFLIQFSKKQTERLDLQNSLLDTHGQA
jgi:hypothetical protein|tara:strand:+ start:413 stop:916 length:504 start_codon:yes stop_codon:yes gene_type:complete